MPFSRWSEAAAESKQPLKYLIWIPVRHFFTNVSMNTAGLLALLAIAGVASALLTRRAGKSRTSNDVCTLYSHQSLHIVIISLRREMFFILSLIKSFIVIKSPGSWFTFSPHCTFIWTVFAVSSLIFSANWLQNFDLLSLYESRTMRIDDIAWILMAGNLLLPPFQILSCKDSFLLQSSEL